MGALDLAAVGTLAAVSDQVSDPGADRRDLLDELLDRLDPRDRPAAVRAGRQRHIDMLVDMGGHGAASAGVSVGASGSLPLALGDLVGVAATERRRLPGGLPLGFVELVAQRLVLGHQIGDPLLQGRDDGAQGPVLLTESFDRREGFRQAGRVRGHDPALRWT
jgi:hypothetical protein